ncbi:helix-hairpin-helix domain-containing protein [Rhodanobacter sp. IGA1.0]|uniref:Helix-hairpin-helix domain-containing protein n=1 Tax=Rhodanobacter sp. IGA1.0 TaxID=3158582 RepID=A0AAU7QQ92_9GAMM
MNEHIHIVDGVMRASESFDDITTGWHFCATMQQRTPASILRRHLEFWPKEKGTPPNICPEGWEGIWLMASSPMPELPGWDDFRSFSDRSMASEVGSIPADGGDYLPFLLALHDLTSGTPCPYSSLEELIRATGIRGTPHARYVERLGGLPGCIGFGAVRAIFLVVWRYDYAERLWAAGFRTVQSLIDSTDEELRSAHSFSKSGLQTIRRAAKKSLLPLAAEFV